jgi:hypothetical protein
MLRSLVLLVPLGAAALFGAANGVFAASPRNGSGAENRPLPGPAQFVRRIDNHWFPLRPGTAYAYRGVRGSTRSRDVVTVTAQSKTIEGVRATAVRDRLYLAGKLAERTTDWYAQDKAGNVWYLGEATAELNAKGKVTSTEGTWQAGVNGGQAGIVMLAHPRIGQRYRQEYLKGHAEDHAAVVSLTDSVRTPATSSRRALLTKEWSPLEPRVIDHKVYVRGIGMVKEVAVKGPVERGVLVAVKR